MSITQRIAFMAAALLLIVCAVAAGEPAGKSPERITPEQAQEIALAKTGGGIVVGSGEVKAADGSEAYAFRITTDRMEYEMKVDARSGAVSDYSAKELTLNF